MTGKIEMAKEHLRQAVVLIDMMETPLVSGKVDPVPGEVIDGIRFQQFRQEGKIDWAYVITSKAGFEYLLMYSALEYGFVKEQLFLKKDGKNVLLLERDVKVGWNYRPTAEEVINRGGRV